MSRQIAPSQLPKSKILDNKYVLGDEIGKGAYGRVYKGLDLENGDFVAIKQVSLENIAQEDLNIIMQEIDLLKILNHKNIVKYLGSLKTKTHLHIVLEYVENGSLANIIKPNKFGPFPEQLVAHYIAQVLEGLVYLHEQGVIHRDIKGANILTTKEGLVKLADFGVATKLTEADVNTHSVVGTPYWMAPEVIEMSGVCAASDIWSVGCTVIELLTCVPPYFDLQPMPALFRIVQDEHPPIPDGLSDDITDFLQQCFKKDARQRPDAKTLLSHPWIQNYRRTLHTSLPLSGSMRVTQEEVLVEAEICNGGNQGGAEGQFVDEVSGRDTLLTAGADASKCNAPGSSLAEKRVESSGDTVSQQAQKLGMHEKPCVEPASDLGSSSSEGVSTRSEQLHEQAHKVDDDVVLMNGDLQSPKPKKKEGGTGKVEGKGSALPKVSLFSCGLRSQEENFQKAVKKVVSTGNELTKFSDTRGDASLEDLFHPLDKGTEARAKTSESASTSYVSPNTAAPKLGNLGNRLRDAIAQKRMAHGMGQANGGSLLRVMINALKEDVSDIDSNLVFEGNLPSPLQAVEFSRLVGSLRPEEPEDVIINSCQKLIAFFHQRTEQKGAFVSQHGLLPLVELLEVPNPYVTCSVLQVLNQIIKDNSDFQENACLVGMIPLVMSFATPDRPRELRLEAAYFLQQLCQSSSKTLQMFIACRGIPVLVCFLEPDYSKYREMVHLAVDGMRQVFKLQRSTTKNDFCRIAAKVGILPRLISTLHSMNEATQLASVNGGGFLPDGSLSRTHSAQLDTSHHGPSATQLGEDQRDLRVRPIIDRSLSNDTDRPMSSRPAIESPNSSKLIDPADKFLNVVKEATRAEMEHRLQRTGGSAGRNSMESFRKSAEGAINQQGQVRPRNSLEKEPPSRNVSTRADLQRLASIERHESVQPLLHASSEKKPNGELDYLMGEYTDVSGFGREDSSSETSPRTSQKASMKKTESSNDLAAPTHQCLSSRLSGASSGSGRLSHVDPVNVDVAKEYLEKVAELLLVFAQADTTVKSHMASESLLNRLFHMFNRVQPPILLKLLKCINYLSTDANCLENLQRADAILHLIPNLELKEGPLVSQVHHEVLNALFNLCKINKKRTEQAAENGIIPHLLNFIMSDSPLKQYALPLLCDMAFASRNSREQLRAHGGLDVYLNLLDDEFWSVTALDSIAVCLAHDDTQKVEQTLLKKDAVHKLVKFFKNCPERHFVHILEPFLKIITKSPWINTTLAVNSLTTLLIGKLDHQDAIARLNLLKLIKAVYEHHPRPKQLIVENDLPQKLQNLIEERRDGQRPGGSGQVLVKQMATSLLKALHINTVL